ncbi:MAG: acetate uptake transporter [Candidatus Thermoplasmatota archaeon]|nr:acetate uptake transporter [Candidatus Thermoplasmatota archaeon]
MTELKTSPSEVHVKEMPMVCEPAALGLAGLAVAALVLGAMYMGFSNGGAKALAIPWILMFGASAQFVAGIMEFKRNNIFGATVFTAYSMTLTAVTITAVIQVFTDAPLDTTHYALGLIGILIFTLIATVISLLTTKLLLTILIVVDIALVFLINHYLTGASGYMAGVFLILTSALSFYGVAAILLNTMAGKQVLPMGKAMWKP